ncbi:hypothetical protein DESC_600057 [Desulfosarcina cetonica]|nr:hypothetical protein DESC_600057 [Desulfosarcina cetonica]
MSRDGAGLLEAGQQVGQFEGKLPESAVNKHAELGDAGIGGGELGQGNARQGKLPQAEHADAELGDVDHPDAELADGDDSPSHHRHAVGAVFEGDMQKGQAENTQAALILETVPVPLLAGRIRCAAARAGNGLPVHGMLAYPT